MKRLSGLSSARRVTEFGEVFLPDVSVPTTSARGDARVLWILAATVSSQALFLGLMASSGKIPLVIFRIFRALLTF